MLGSSDRRGRREGCVDIAVGFVTPPDGIQVEGGVSVPRRCEPCAAGNRSALLASAPLASSVRGTCHEYFLFVDRIESR